MISVDTVLDLLHDQERRYVFYYLDEQTAPVPIGEVAEAVADMAAPTDGAGISGTSEQIEVSIHHKHLPKMEPLGFVSHHVETNEIEIDDPPTTFDTLLITTKVLEME
ncbi:DUF7344 domain-containing protein [Natrinema salsiterrestre]|uniref:DUF7344 domain-containing protein n=1 Tax=Natrinema salsiterrestre TaxID=2950540 RepID=A0A9Q4L101_9EURY|nr:hypothetical protein [Natrinema salsiterrestre]MDF9747878.1 hypothetical protein [Natrinema salsiterrestre]